MGCKTSISVSSNTQSNAVHSQRLKVSDNILNQSQTTRFVENCVIVWLTDQSSIEEKNLLKQFRHIISALRIFTDSDACFTFINNIHDEKIFLVISPEYKQFIDRIHHLSQILKVYIFDPKFQMLNNIYACIVQSDIFRNSTDLCNQLCEDRELFELDCVVLTTVLPLSSDEVALKCKASFLLVQYMKEIVVRYKFENDAKDRFVEFCRIHYADDDEQLREIDDFDRTYRPQKALYWLTRNTFVSRILNRTQHTLEIDLQYKISFIIKHIHIQLAHYSNQNDSPSKDTSWTFYRGKTMLQHEFDILLRNSSGGLLSFSCFIMASRNKNVAIDLLHRLITDNPQRIAVLFEIYIDTTKHVIIPFALLENNDHEDHSKKGDICFGIGTVFRIQSIEQVNEYSIQMWQVKLILVDDSDSQLFHLVEALHNNDIQTNPLAFAGKLLVEMGDFDRAEQFYIQILLDPSVLNQPRRCCRIQTALGSVFTLKNEFNKALEHYQQALKASLSFLPPDHPDLIPIHSAIADCYYETGNYLLALQSYERAAQLIQPNMQSIDQQSLNDLNNHIVNIRKLLNSSA
ncbi:unnamed protein product [Rotaria sp. Silwood2]|nr:unnamed protein product [Rotaria sp. Silwood2]CAF4565851.1 unnamed protein product [Rotaria sp. Silwood2]